MRVKKRGPRFAVLIDRSGDWKNYLKAVKSPNYVLDGREKGRHCEHQSSAPIIGVINVFDFDLSANTFDRCLTERLKNGFIVLRTVCEP